MISNGCRYQKPKNLFGKLKVNPYIARTMSQIGTLNALCFENEITNVPKLCGGVKVVPMFILRWNKHG